MKRYFILLLLTLGFSAVYAQQDYKVSTEEEKRGILLEEFTGSYCPNCPDGHAIAKSIGKGFRGQAHLVSIHTGSFSPTKGSFILRTDDGEDIAAKFPPKGFPTGMISRHLFNGNFVHGREGWKTLANKLKDDVATVNLYAEGTYDGSDRTLKIHTEGYSAADNSSKDMRLNVIITQDYIKGYQKGSAEGDNYMHMHVLRDYITPTQGDVIDKKGKGDYFTADYTYSVPTEINGQELKPQDMRIIVFVTENGMEEVANVKSIKPAYLNMNIEPQAVLYEPDIETGQVYGYQFFEANLRNLSTEVVTKATFDVKLNNDLQEVVADCNIDPFETGYVKIPCSYNFNEDSAKGYQITLKRINDHDVEQQSIAGGFNRPPFVDNGVIVNIKTDKQAEENEFTLKDEHGNVIMTFGPFENGKAHTFEKTIKLDKAGTYCVEVIDHFGNGMKDGKRGSLITCTLKKDLIDYIDDIPDNGARSFFTVETDLAIDGITIDKNQNGTTYSLSGMVIDGKNSGERIVIRNGLKYINR